jgi:phosphonate transport system substrate-binding protein
MFQGAFMLTTLLQKRLLALFLVNLLFFTTTACCLAGAEAASPPSPAKEYSFGVFPFLAPSTLEGAFAPIAEELAVALNRPVHFQATASFAKFRENLEMQEYDIAHVQPFDYVTVAAPAGYLPLVVRAQTLSAVFVVTAEIFLKDARDLSGRKIGLPPQTAAVTYLAKVALQQEGIELDDVRFRYFSTHQACMQAALIGDVDSGAVGPTAFRLFEARSGRPFRVVLTSPEIKQTLFVVHERVAEADRELILRTLLETRLSGMEPGIRAHIFETNKTDKDVYFLPVTDQDYDIVRHYLEMSGDK